jgi:hypothetical protein
LANGRHWDLNPISGTYPVGHMQPWGQIYIQDPNTTDDNVTFYFEISIQECYDCFYMNSFVSKADFKVQATGNGGPPCCTTPSVIVGNGVDKYYMTFSFDNTANNSYLVSPPEQNVLSSTYVGDELGNHHVLPVGQFGGIPGDAIVPDAIFNSTIFAARLLAGDTLEQAQAAAFYDPIKSRVANNQPYQARFTLNGVLTYTWNLKFVSNQDISPEFIGTGKYVANGYGFIQLYCALLDSATITFSEKAVKDVNAVTGEDWAANWIGIGAEWVQQLDDAGALTGLVTPYENWVDSGSPTYNWNLGEQQPFGTFYPTPINVSTSLSHHENFNNQYPANNENVNWSAWPTGAWIKSLSW